MQVLKGILYGALAGIALALCAWFMYELWVAFVLHIVRTRG